MPSLQQPQNQAGIMSFYDAPELGPKVNVKSILLIVVVFSLVIIVLNHFATV